MEQIKNSCNNRGCEVRIILPFDRRVESLSAEMLRKRNDSQAVLSLVDLPLDQEPIKKAA